MEPSKMDEIYMNAPLDKIPWNFKTPPDLLIELIENGILKPCKAIDLGCGTGNTAIFLASQGFEVTGVDFSPVAIEIAKKNANSKKIKCNFLVADVLSNLNQIQETFDFAYDWELLHHIFPDKRKGYIENVNKLLKPKGKYLSVCFSEKDPQFGGSGKYRETIIGTVLYFSSENEIKDLLEPYFNIIELKTIEIRGKTSPHFAIYAFGEKK
ncbi:MAG: class I SAM-dependent methyltransferase [Candidatus Helarchaeota archaeon]|nr:class I SAM-dependent methyltransferase [Candidatus Helarchaeota archaeon]